MKAFSTYFFPGRKPVFVRDGFSWGAAVFGWLWLLFAGAAVPACLLFLTAILVLRLGQALHTDAFTVALFVLQGAFARDIKRWDLTRRGYTQGPVVCARNRLAARARLFDARDDLRAAAAWA